MTGTTKLVMIAIAIDTEIKPQDLRLSIGGWNKRHVAECAILSIDDVNGAALAIPQLKLAIQKRIADQGGMNKAAAF